MRIIVLLLLLSSQMQSQSKYLASEVEQQRYRDRQVSSVRERTLGNNGDIVMDKLTLIDHQGRPSYIAYRSGGTLDTAKVDNEWSRFSYTGGLLSSEEHSSGGRVEYEYDSLQRVTRATTFYREGEMRAVEVGEERWIYDPTGDFEVHMLLIREPEMLSPDQRSKLDTGKVDFWNPEKSFQVPMRLAVTTLEYQFDKLLKIKNKLTDLGDTRGRPDTIVLYHAVGDGYEADSGRWHWKFDKLGYMLREWGYGELHRETEYKYNDSGLATEAIHRLPTTGAILTRVRYEYTYH